MEVSSTSKQLENAVECINTNRSIKSYFQLLNLNKNDLEKCNTILDIGSGIEQRFARDCKEMGIKAQVVSIDPGIVSPQNQDLRYVTDKDFIKKRITARKNPAEGTISAISQHLPFKNNSFDMVLALYSVPLHLHQTDDVGLILNEIFRVLKSGGEARIYPFTMDSKEKKEIDAFIQKHEDIKIEKQLDKIDQGSYLIILTKTSPSNL